MIWRVLYHNLLAHKEASDAIYYHASAQQLAPPPGQKGACGEGGKCAPLPQPSQKGKCAPLPQPVVLIANNIIWFEAYNRWNPFMRFLASAVNTVFGVRPPVE